MEGGSHNTNGPAVRAVREHGVRLQGRMEDSGLVLPEVPTQTEVVQREKHRGAMGAPTENDTEAYISAVVCLSGLGGYENIPRPNRYRNFDRLEKTARLIAAMTCVENGLRWEQVDWKAIWEGYDLAYPGRRLPGLAAEAAMNTPPAWEEPTTEDLQRAADLFIWDEYRDW